MRQRRGFWSDESGATAVEYSLIIALIFLAMIAGVRTFASGTIQLWNSVEEKVEAS